MANANFKIKKGLTIGELTGDADSVLALAADGTVVSSSFDYNNILDKTGDTMSGNLTMSSGADIILGSSNERIILSTNHSIFSNGTQFTISDSVSEENILQYNNSTSIISIGTSNSQTTEFGGAITVASGEDITWNSTGGDIGTTAVPAGAIYAGSISLENGGNGIQMKSNAGTYRQVMQLNASDILNIGSGNEITQIIMGSGDNVTKVLVDTEISSPKNAGNTEAFGVNALKDNTVSGINNTAFGANALSNNTDGNANGAFGSAALGNITEGIQNNSFGVSTLQTNLSGDGNSAFGHAVLRDVEGSFNAGFGSQSLLYLQSGTHNTAVGYRAGFSATNGVILNNCTFIGKGAVPTTNDIGNSTAIGHGSGVDASNQITLGDDNITEVNLGGLSTPIGRIDSDGLYVPQVFSEADASTNAKICAIDIDGYFKPSGVSRNQLMRGTLLNFDATQANYLSGATVTLRNTTNVLSFDDSVNEYAIFVSTMPQIFQETTCRLTLYWAAASATTGNCSWRIYFERVGEIGNSYQNIDSDGFVIASTINSSPEAVNGDVKGSFSSVSIPDGIEPGDIFRVKVERLASTGTDTMVGDAQLLAFEIQNFA